MGPIGVDPPTTRSPASRGVRGMAVGAATSLIVIACSLAASLPGSSSSRGLTSPAPRPSGDTGGEVTITITQTSVGPALAGPNGMTLYVRTTDKDATSTCTTGGCAEAWPALIGEPSMLRIGPYVVGTFGVTIWPDGTQQVIHNGQPLYFYDEDQVPGDANGHGKGDVWCVALNAAESGCDVLSPGEKWNLETFHAPRPAVRAAETTEDY